MCITRGSSPMQTNNSAHLDKDNSFAGEKERQDEYSSVGTSSSNTMQSIISGIAIEKYYVSLKGEDRVKQIDQCIDNYINENKNLDSKSIYEEIKTDIIFAENTAVVRNVIDERGGLYTFSSEVYRARSHGQIDTPTEIRIQVKLGLISKEEAMRKIETYKEVISVVKSFVSIMDSRAEMKEIIIKAIESKVLPGYIGEQESQKSSIRSDKYKTGVISPKFLAAPENSKITNILKESNISLLINRLDIKNDDSVKLKAYELDFKAKVEELKNEIEKIRSAKTYETSPGNTLANLSEKFNLFRHYGTSHFEARYSQNDVTNSHLNKPTNVNLWASPKESLDSSSINWEDRIGALFDQFSFHGADRIEWFDFKMADPDKVLFVNTLDDFLSLPQIESDVINIDHSFEIKHAIDWGTLAKEYDAVLVRCPTLSASHTSEENKIMFDELSGYDANSLIVFNPEGVEVVASSDTMDDPKVALLQEQYSAYLTAQTEFDNSEENNYEEDYYDYTDVGLLDDLEDIGNFDDEGFLF